MGVSSATLSLQSSCHHNLRRWSYARHPPSPLQLHNVVRNPAHTRPHNPPRRAHPSHSHPPHQRPRPALPHSHMPLPPPHHPTSPHNPPLNPLNPYPRMGVRQLSRLRNLQLLGSIFPMPAIHSHPHPAQP